MSIRKLPEYIINRLKAGEIVERPASIIKELVENSLDADSNHIKITVNDGGKSLISVEDNGSGIELSDMDLLLERYATSKINGEHDLNNLQSYGFRGEALASIAEVSKVSVISKTAYAEIATKLTKIQESLVMNHVPVGFKHGTVVSVQDLFFNVPARLKFLKSTQTEYFYCYNYFTEISLFHHDKHFTLLKNDKIAFDLPPVDGLMDRVLQIWRKDWSKHLHPVEFEIENIKIQGIVSDAGLSFGSMENIKIFVNGRPVVDRVIRKAVLDAYHRQITPGEYPFAILMLTVDPAFVDVNVHPKKLEVKFLDSNLVFSFVHESIKKTLGFNKITTTEHSVSQNFDYNKQEEKSDSQSADLFNSEQLFSGKLESTNVGFSQSTTGFSNKSTSISYFNEQIGNYKIIGQVWNKYIVIASADSLFYVDQHALAERIAFEKMKKSNGYLKSELLLNPLTIEIGLRPDIEQKIEELNALGFDASMISENKIIIYAVPQVFSIYKIDIEHLLEHVFALDEISFDHVLDTIFATKACKTSIKAGDPLSYEQMAKLLQDGFETIEGMFVCQHGRPFFVKIEEKSIDKFFDR